MAIVSSILDKFRSESTVFTVFDRTIPSSVSCTLDQGSEGVPYSLDLSIQTLDECWFGFASQARNIDCYNISVGLGGKTIA